jgi:antitoxin component YwqK of YwqJK toxin-antitoxin module
MSSGKPEAEVFSRRVRGTLVSGRHNETDAALQAAGNYRDGLQKGPWKMNDENGTLQSEETYMREKLIDQKTYGRQGIAVRTINVCSY